MTIKQAFQAGRQSARIHKTVDPMMPMGGSWCIPGHFSEDQKVAFVLGFLSKL